MNRVDSRQFTIQYKVSEERDAPVRTGVEVVLGVVTEVRAPLGPGRQLRGGGRVPRLVVAVHHLGVSASSELARIIYRAS